MLWGALIVIAVVDMVVATALVMEAWPVAGRTVLGILALVVASLCFAGAPFITVWSELQPMWVLLLNLVGLVHLVLGIAYLLMAYVKGHPGP